MNRRAFIARMIGGLVAAVTAEPILKACVEAKVTPEEVKSFKPRWVMVEISKLKHNTKMFRRSYPPMVEQLAESIAKMGLVIPITINQDYTIIDGHHRVEACRSIGLTQIAALQFDFTEEEVIDHVLDMNTIRV